MPPEDNPADDVRPDELDYLRAENARLLEAVQAAYWHLDTYGAINGHEQEMGSQRRVFALCRPFCPPIPGRL